MRTDDSSRARKRRIVVARRWTGIGDCLVSLLAAHRYAKSTGRTLVVDWRGTAYAPHDNLFPRIFRAPTIWDGVETLPLDASRGFAIDGPTWPAGWTTDALAAAPIAGERGDSVEAIERIVAGADAAEPVVVFDGCIAPVAPDEDACRRLLGALHIRDDVAREVDAFAHERFGDAPVVGVHARHGNGGAIMGHTIFWENPGDALSRIADETRSALAALRESTGRDAIVFLSTDSADLEALLGRMFPRLVARPKAFRPSGEGELHLGPDAHAGLVDALVDMLLLAKVDRLVRYPPGSYFSFWGSVMMRTDARG